MIDKYILKEGQPIPEPDLLKWGLWLERSDRRVARTVIGESRVSTVFLGLDHGYGGGPPILWETMVFGGKLDQQQDRCSGNKEQAEAMHKAMCKKVRAAK